MRRRTLLSASLGATLAGLPATLLAQSNGSKLRTTPQVVVVGAGIVGASIAWHLSQRGCQVTVLEAREPACQASGNSFAWINASYAKVPRSYYTLSSFALHEYHRLAEQLDLPLHWGGCLEWMDDSSAQAEMVASIDTIRGFGSPTWMIPAERARSLAPAIDFGPATDVAFCALDGAVDAKLATEQLLQGVQDSSGNIVYPARVSAITRTGNKIVASTAAGEFTADHLVIAAGLGTTNLAQKTGFPIPQRPTPGIIVTTAPLSPILEPVIVAPGVHIHQRKDGRVVLGEQAGAPATQEHRAFLAEYPNRHPSPELAEQHAQRIMTIATQFLPALAQAQIEEVGIGWRPMPMDGLPVVGRHPSERNIYFAVMHSGVTLAPLVGRLAATEILDEIAISLLDDFRPARLQG